MANIELNVVALGDFKGLEAQLKSLQTQINTMNTQLASSGMSLTAKQTAALANTFNQAMMQSGLFTSKLVNMSTAAEHLGQRITKSKTTMSDYRSALKGVSSETSLYNQLAQRQVAMQQAIVQNLGGGMARVYAQHNVDLSSSAIKSKVLTQAIVAQNAALNQAAIKVINWGKNMQWAGRQLTAGLTMPVTMFAGAIATMYNDVDKNLTRLARVYGVGLDKPTQATLNAIKKDVIGLSKELGSQLGITAKEVTDTAAQFAAAGLTGEQLIGATKQASRMVVLGETDKQTAITATIALQTAYKLNTEQVTEATNFFNAAQAATSTSMNDLVEAIPKVGPVISGLGGSYKDMVAILTAMKEGGVPASEAANAIKNSLGRIINPTKAAQNTLKGFGIDINSIVAKNAGNLIGTLTDLQSGLDKLSSLDRQRAIAELFGKFQFARMAAFMDNFNKTGTQSAKVVEMMGMSASDLAAIADDQTKKIQQSASGRFKITLENLKNSLLPMGEAALNMFTGILEKLQGLFDFIQNLPGPIKNFLKLFGTIGLVAGPFIMLTGLFGNLIGQIGRGFISLRTFGIALTNVGNKVNPLTILGKRFNVLTEEMVAESNAAKIFGESMNAATSPINAVTTAIERLIAEMQTLNGTSLTGAVNNVRQMSSATGVALARASSGEFTGLNRSHYMPFSSMVPQGMTTTQYGNQAVISSGDKSRIRNLSTTGTSFIPGHMGERMQAAIGSKQTIIYNGYEQVAKSLQDEIKLKLEGRYLEEHINQALALQFKTEQQVLEIEASDKAARIVMAEKNSQLGIIISEKVSQAQKDLLLTNNYSEELAITSRLQAEINALLANDPMYLEVKEMLMNDYNEQLAVAVTFEEKENAMRTLLARLQQEEVVEIKAYNEALGLNVGQTQRMQQVLRVAAEASAGIPLAIEELVTALKQETIQAQAIVPAGASGKGLRGVMSGSGIAMGVGMGATMAGGMMMGSENKGVATVGQSLMYGGMIASIAPMLGMSGPVGLAIGATVALGVAIKHVVDEQNRMANAAKESFSISSIAAQQFGVTIRNLADVEIKHLVGNSKEATDAVSQMADAYSKAEGITKDYIDYVRGLSDSSSITSEMTKKFYSDIMSGLTPDQARKDIAAILQAAGQGGYSLDVRLKLQDLNPEDTKKAFEDLFNSTINEQTTAAQSAMEKAKSKALGLGLKESDLTMGSLDVGFDASRYTQGQIDAIDEYRRALETLDLQVGTSAKQYENLNELIMNAFNTMPLEDFTYVMQKLQDQGYLTEDSFQGFIDKVKESNPEFAKVLQDLKDQGAEFNATAVAAQLYADGTITSIEQVRLAASIPVVLDYYINEHRQQVETQTTTNYAKSASGMIKPSQATGSSGGSSDGSGKSAADKQIEKNNKIIEQIKSQQTERKKLIDLQNKELDFSKTKMSLETQIADALASGNFLKAKELQNELAVAQAKKDQEDAQSAADEADNIRIKQLEDANKKLQAKKSKGGGGSGGGSGEGSAAVGFNEDSVNSGLQQYLSTKYFKTLKDFHADKDVQLIVEQYKKLGYSTEEANKKAEIYYHQRKIDIAGMATDLTSSRQGMERELDQFGAKWITLSDDMKNSMKLALESAMIENTDANSRLEATAKILSDNLGIPIDEAKAKAQKLIDLYKNPIDASNFANSVVNEMQRIQNETKKAWMTEYALKYYSSHPGSSYADAVNAAQNAFAEKHAAGGIITGKGSGTSDSIPAMLSNGEYVIKASAVSKYGKEVMDSINAGTLNLSGISAPTFNIPGAATSATSSNSTNNVTINADFNISGGDPKGIADEVMKKLELAQKKAGGRVRF